MHSFIFDFNGTLYQDCPMHLSAWGRFYAEHGVPFTEDMFYKYMCGPADAEIIRFMMGDQLPDDLVHQMAEDKERYYREIVLNDPSLQALTPGAVEMFDMLTKKGASFAIATGSPKSNVDFYMNTLRIDRWFDYDHIFYEHKGIPGKPDPAIYRMAIEHLGYDPDNTIVVEDGLAGVHSAIGAGIKSIVAIDTSLGSEAFKDIPEIIAIVHDFYGFERFL